MLHNLPYKRVSKIMSRYLALVCTHQLNIFPAKGGVSDYFSPHTIMTQKKVDYNKHCKVPFGAYVQATVDNQNKTNSNLPRTIDAIYLRPMTNVQGGYEVMNLATGRMVTTNLVTELPITEHVIKSVETMAEEQGIKSNKIEGRNKVPLHPANWIAGVDYEPNNQNNDGDDEEPPEMIAYNHDAYDSSGIESQLIVGDIAS